MTALCISTSNRSNVLSKVLSGFAVSVRNVKKIRRMEDPEYTKSQPVFKHAPDKLNVKKRIFTWGNAETGALGNVNFLFPADGKKAVEEFKRPHRLAYVTEMDIFDVAAGYGFTVFAANERKSDYKLFGSGLNTDSQIGCHLGEENVPLQVLIKPTPIQLPLQNKERVLRVACGRSHTVCITNEGRVFTLGNNAFGQCGRPMVHGEIYLGRHNVFEVKNIPEPVTDVICGQDHTIFLCKDGSLYSCGWGADGQTGLGTYESVWKPTKLKGDIEGETIIKVSSTADSVLACNEKGDLFGWGNSEYAQFSLVTGDKQLSIPRHLPLKGVKKVVGVAAGGTMCAILDDGNNVFVWGFGLLGKGPKVDHLANPSMLPPTLFGCDEFNPEVKVVSIHAGLSNFAAITNTGDLYMWGKNRNGNLGTNKLDDVYFPWRIPVPANVKKVSLGIDHSVALCTTLV
ncbi:putative E3 ubiquitin-protein ligase HERC4 [Halotydeus destructor]|nr:putative E3 ubiquitin-protein ligase HERC4 [Halotydeus destructor]